MTELPADVRRALTEGLEALAPGGVRHVEHDGHSFAVVKLTSAGIHTGQPRFLVACRLCFRLIHDGTTGPISNIEAHIREFSTLEHPKSRTDVPIPMRLICPECKALHIDVALADKPHHTHACQNCGNVWRPALVNTVGVRFLPGYKDEPTT